MPAEAHVTIRALTGYVAHALLGLYWLWVVSHSAVPPRRGAS